MPVYRKLLVASSKGGVGKSTTALGLAAAFAAQDLKVLLIDFDGTSRSLDILAGAEDMTTADTADISPGSVPAVHPFDSLPCLSLVPACPPERLASEAKKRDLTREEFLRAIIHDAFAADYDLFICDTGGGIDIAQAIADLFDMVLIPSEQSQTSIRASEYAASSIGKNAPKIPMRLVICSFDLTAVKKENRAGVIEMIDAAALQCAGVVPYDRKLQRAQDNGRLPPDNSLSRIAYRNIAKRLTGYDVPLFDGMKKLSGKRRAAF
jgi:septum formation inhibitor-activating ATPase MinD